MQLSGEVGILMQIGIVFLSALKTVLNGTRNGQSPFSQSVNRALSKRAVNCFFSILTQ